MDGATGAARGHLETEARAAPAIRKAAGAGLRAAACIALAALLLPGPTMAQTRVISGRVAAAGSGQPLGSADVRAAGGAGAMRVAAATLSREDGRFSLSVPTGEVQITVRLLGYRTATATVAADRSSVVVALELDPLRLDEIIVTGQVTGIPRRNLPNAVATIGAEQLGIVPTGSIETQLAGKVAGVDVQANSGAPGGGNQVTLRGASTILGGAQPLYVVDGVIVSNVAVASGANSITLAAGGGIASNQDNAPNRIADLNPADIERIEVLRGAAAAAIYGSKANNGVVLISTRTGRPGDTRFGLTQRVGFSRLANRIGTRRFKTVEEAIAAGGTTAADFLAPFGGVVPPGPFDLEEELAGGNAPARETALSMTGGDDRTRFYVSGLAHDERGVVRNTFYDKYSLTLNLDRAVSERLTVAVHATAVQSKTARGFTGNDNSGTAYYMALSTTPSYVDLRRRADGTFPKNPFAHSNPLQTAELADNTETVQRLIGSARGSYDLLRADRHTIELIGLAGADIFELNDAVYAPEDVQFECSPEGPACSPVESQYPGTSAVGRTLGRQANFNLNAVHTFTARALPVKVVTSTGVQYEYRDGDVLRVEGVGLSPGQRNVSQSQIQFTAQSRDRGKDLGLYAQEEVLVRDRLLLTGAVRGERSSNNAETDRWFYYPKASTSLRLTPGRAPLEELKLRVAFGQSGLQPPYGRKFNNLSPGFTNGLRTLLLGSSTSATDLRPERQTEVEGGFDATALHGSVGLELTAYHRRVDDLLLTRSLAASTGYSTATFNNAGWMTTRGIEAAFRATARRSSRLSWSGTLTFAADRSRMDSLSAPAFRPPNAGFGTALGDGWIQQGKSLTQIRGRDTARVLDDPRCLESLGARQGEGKCPLGKTFFTQIGDARPDFRMGFSSSIRWSSLSLATTVDWQHGGNVLDLFGWALDIGQNARDFADACLLPGCMPGETIGAYRLRVYPSKTSRPWVESASFLKVREAAVGWRVAPALLRRARLHAAGADLTLSARNLIRITRYRGLDPEVSNFGATPIRTNVDMGPYPPSRSFWLTADLRF